MEESAAYQGSDSLDYDLRFLGNYPTAVVAFHGRLSWQTKEEKKDGGTFPSCCINFTRLGNIVSFWTRIGISVDKVFPLPDMDNPFFHG